MRLRRLRFLPALAAGLALLSPVAGDAWAGGPPTWAETVLATFGTSSKLIRDASGNLYGTVAFGPAGASGAVFELSPPGRGSKTWTTTILHAFPAFTGDGSEPQSGLLADASGALYGTTYYGGIPSCDGGIGCGTVFKLSPPAAGQTGWTETVLHAFSYAEGAGPAAEVIADSHGNLFGSNLRGGAFNNGTIFKLTPPTTGNAAWTQTTIHAFTGYPEGRAPVGLVGGAGGAIFGTTRFGGALSDDGTIFELKPSGGAGAYALSTIYSFAPGAGGWYPTSGLIIDARGALYGTTTRGGLPGAGSTGAVFSLSPPAAGQTAWKESTLFAFSYQGDLGGFPHSGVIAEGGNLYGTVFFGGPYRQGMAYKLAPPKAGQTAWTQTVMHYFGNGASGDVAPQAELVADGRGTLYGACNGTIFALVPQ